MEQGVCIDSVRFNQLVAELGGDESGAIEVLGIFVSELPRYADALQAAASANDFFQILHKFRGSLLAMGIADIATSIAVLEQEAKAGRVMNTAAVASVCDLIADITRQCTKLLPES